MGEYAIRKSDHAEIKIGTCEDMYYLRFEDRAKVAHKSGNVDPVKDAASLRFRLPFPDEDSVRPGEYQDFERGLRLSRKVGEGPRSHWEDFTDASTAEDPGIIQLHHKESGLLVNVPCYHGQKLPDLGPSAKAFWNGKGHSLELTQLRPMMENGELHVLPVVHCRHCGKAWRYEWPDVMDFIMEKALRERLEVYASASVTA